MPANLTPQYFAAEKQYKAAKTPQEKIAALEEMLAVMPKHKGTEHLQGDIKARIAKLKKQPFRKGPTAKKSIFDIDREGAGQIVLIGPPNTGKSQLIKALTNCNPVIAPYPFSTRKPVVGMMKYKNIQIQLIDIPPLSADYIDPWVPNLLRNTDLFILVIDISSGDPFQQIEKTREILNDYKIKVVGKESPDEYVSGVVPKKVIIACNKSDIMEDKENYAMLSELYEEQFPLILISSENDHNLENLMSMVFNELEIIRVYTKAPGKQPDFNSPWIFGKDTSVIEVARSIHKEFEDKFKFAKIWGSSKFEGQKVQRDFLLEDEDIIEIHI